MLVSGVTMYEPIGPTTRITQGELTECLRAAFDALSPEDQESLNRAMKPLLDIPKMGLISALELLFKLYRAGDLARLNETLVKGG